MNEPNAAVEVFSPVGTSEAVLVEAAKARSSSAWAEIYETHYRSVFRYVRARVFDEATAEDLAASVFVEALKGIGAYHYRGKPLLAWLYRIARNVVADYQRETLTREGSGLTRRLVSGLFGRWTSGTQTGPEPEVLASGSAGDPATMIESLDIRRAIARLPQSQREVIILRFFVGLNAEEIAGLVGKGPAAVYSLQARAIVALRNELA